MSNYRGHVVLRALVARLCHIPGHGDIFWSKHNIIDEHVRRFALDFMKERFDLRDAVTMLSVIDDAGVERGTIGQSVHTLVDTIAATHEVMESIAKDDTQTERVRHSAILFAVSAAQSKSAATALEVLSRIRTSIDDEELSAVLRWLEGDIRQYGYVSLY